MDELYFETHVTVDPLTEEQQHLADAVLTSFGFKRAELVMLKDNTVSPHYGDAFYSSRHYGMRSARQSVAAAVGWFTGMGIRVRRYKIEFTIMDSRIEDQMNLLGGTDNAR